MPSTPRNLDDALAACLEDLESGLTLAQCLARYPQYADELAPLLATAARLASAKPAVLSLAKRVQGRERMHVRLAARRARALRWRAVLGQLGMVLVMLAFGAGVWLAWPGAKPWEATQPTAIPSAMPLQPSDTPIRPTEPEPQPSAALATASATVAALPAATGTPTTPTPRPTATASSTPTRTRTPTVTATTSATATPSPATPTPTGTPEPQQHATTPTRTATRQPAITASATPTRTPELKESRTPMTPTPTTTPGPSPTSGATPTPFPVPRSTASPDPPRVSLVWLTVRSSDLSAAAVKLIPTLAVTPSPSPEPAEERGALTSPTPTPEQ